MTENTNAQHGIEDAAGTAEGNGHTLKEPRRELFTDWSNDIRLDAADNFDEDQAAIHNWNEADSEERLHALAHRMTLADAEELNATARSVAIEHARRAERARQLVTIVAARLGREAEALHATDPVTVGKAVPVQTKMMPAAARTMPSAS